MPDGEAEGDLVDHIGQVVDQVQRTGVDGGHQIAEEVTQGIDGPADGDDETHGAESGGDEDASILTGDLAGLSVEDFVENVEPSAHSEDETGQGRNTEGVLLTAVAEGKHSNCSEKKTPEHHTGDVGLDGGEDQVEFDHLKGHGQRPVDVTVDDRGGTNLDPVLTHVEVVNSGDQSDQRSDVHGRLPVSGNNHRFHEEKDGGGDHGNGDDPEGNGNAIRRVKNPWLSRG